MSDMDQIEAPPRPAASHTPRPTKREQSGMVDRIKTSLQTLAFGNPLYDLSLGGAGEQTLRLVPPDPWPGEARLGSDLVQGMYRFAGQSVQSEVVAWEPTGVSEKFIETLHSFDWLRDLRALGGDIARRQARAMVRSWIEHNSAWNPVSWDPVWLARRVSNWLSMYDFFCATADEEFRTLVLDSLKRQSRHLARTLPTVAKGGGRFTALKGLFFSSICLAGGDARLAYALKLLGPEINAQVLPDGGHISRSPSLHLHVLRDLIDIRTVLSAGAQEIPEKLQHAIDRMTPAVRFFRHGDNMLALFNGGREETAALIDAVLTHADAKGRPLKTMVHSGYERVTAGRTCILFDGGPPPPAGQDTEAHAAPLSFEMSVGRDRLIVNCGAHPTGFQGWRKAMASTAAHSTLTLNDTNSAEIIDGGMGRKPKRVSCERQEEAGAVWLDARHDGYDPLFHTTHYRRLYIADSGEDIRGEDTLEGPAGYTFALRFHLHPGVQASVIQGGGAVLLATPSGGGWRLRAQGGTLSLEESLYCGKGDEPRRSHQIVISGETTPDSTAVKWALQRERRG